MAAVARKGCGIGGGGIENGGTDGDSVICNERLVGGVAGDKSGGGERCPSEISRHPRPYRAA